MKFIVSRSKLFKAVQALGGVITPSNTMPILEDFLFELSDNKLSITASNLETTMVASIQPDMVDGSGQVTIPARLFIDAIKNFPDIPLSFNISEDTYAIEITTNEGVYKMVGHSSSEFPQLPRIEDSDVLEVPADVLACGFEKTIFATGSDEIRPVMTGVYLNVSDTCLTFVATDAHRLVRYKRFDVKSDRNSSIIIPKKPVNQLKAVLSTKGDDKVLVKFNRTNVSFDLGDFRLICRLIEGVYPNYEAVIPTNNPNKLVVDCQLLNAAIRRVGTFSNKATHQVRLKISGQELLISAEDLDYYNEAKERLTCSYEGADMEIGFNSRFLQDILSNITQQSVRIELSAPNRAGIMTPVDNENADEDILMLLMPVMLS